MTTTPSTLPIQSATVTAALAQLETQVDEYNTARMLAYLTKTVPETLGIPPACVVVTYEPGNDVVAIAAMSPGGAQCATSGAKADCVAGPKAWAAARCDEIRAQWAPMDAATQQAAATVAKPAVV